MADNTTASAGYLTPTNVVPYDDDLIDLLQPMFVGVSGVPGSMFRPRWQPDDVPNQPEQGETWASLGIARTRTDTFAYEEHVDDGNGYDYLQRSEELDVLVSFYGPNCKSICEQTRDGLAFEQNRDVLVALKMDLVAVGDSILLPALLAGKWQRRCDVTVTLRRCVERKYGVLTIVGLPDQTDDGAQAGIDNEQYITLIDVEAPE